MEYKYALKENYEDFASGRVMYSAKGVPNFPVRLQAELFCRAKELSVKKTDLCVYDPCCGGGYSLTTLGFMFSDCISKLVGSDLNSKMLEVAKRNLSLLSEEGLKNRSEEITALYQQYHKESHKEALESSRYFGSIQTQHIVTELYEADCTKSLPPITPDIIITDVPYGNMVEWNSSDQLSIDAMMKQLYKISGETTILVVCMNKGQKAQSSDWIRVEKQTIGKRKFEIYRHKSSKG